MIEREKMEDIKDQAHKIFEISNGNICNRCLGRVFYPAVTGPDNQERGELIKQILNYEGQASAKNNECYLCHDLFVNIENLIDQVLEKIKYSGIEFSTFLVGCKLPQEMMIREKKVQEIIQIVDDSAKDTIKREINRIIGKEVSLRLLKEVDFNNPNLVVMIDFVLDELHLQINPLFIEGRYRKLIRGIPQTRWPCRNCKGSGCERCNYTGKMYPESVEELIAKEVLLVTDGKETKFHGAGREDIDVRMLGRGRPFVLEVKEPRVRGLNLKELEYKINQKAKGKVEVSNLNIVGKERRGLIKATSRQTYKTYLALVELEGEIFKEDLLILKSLKIIKQRTPIRVSHRRADKIRVREVKDIKFELLNSNLLKLFISCEGGLYIKELISGDKKRTEPSVASMLGIPARCVELDVLEVNI
jgi:tRNA pseudouridine synthase 10